MYKRILLAYDGSLEGRTALREGALLAYQCHAEVHLLAVVGGSAGFRMAASAHGDAMVHQQQRLTDILNEGMDKLKQLGVSAKAKLVAGDPAAEIGAFAREIDADLIVVGHRRQSFLDRWWSGASGAYLVDQTKCSLLVSRNTITEDAFDALLQKSTA
jgi:nucleotide-binding universal stress UspA family protein